MTRGDLAARLRRLDTGPPIAEVPRESLVEQDPRRRFPIDVRRTSLPAMTAQAWAAIEAANDPPTTFVIGTTPVRIAGGVNGEPVTTQELTVDMLRRLSARTAFWHRFTEKEGELEAFPLEPVMRDMLADPAPPLPALTRVTAAPVCGPDGSIAYAPGYHPATGTYYAPMGAPVDAPPEDPSPAEIAAARALLLDEFLGDFPFVSDAERAHALSLLLNPFLRDLIEGPTPLYLIEAPSAGTGKGLLAHMLLLPALGAPPPLLPPAGNEEETRKRLTAALVTLPEALLLDNISKGIDSPSLAAALTATVWTDRMLGRTETRSVRIRATWAATANNPSMTREIARRIVRIRLDAQAERPEERAAFRHRHLARWAADHRRELIRAALTLVHAWLAEGAPMGDHVLGSFDAWAQIHGGVLDVAGVPGFLANRHAGEGSVVNRDAATAQLVEQWWEKHRNNVVPVAQLFDIAREIDDYPLGNSTSERGMRTTFGMKLGEDRDRVFSGKRITRVDRGRNGAAYQLVPTEETPF